MAGFEGLLTGHTLADRYTIGEVIGRGGFAAVYEATDERLRRVVAVKVITAAASEEEQEEIRRRFDREARASASLHHPNVVSIYDFGTDPRLGIDFLVMERLRGEDLRARIRRGDRLSVPTAVRILRDAADGVDAGHRTGLVHRDLKPGNIYLAQLNRADWFRVCVVDFGIARIVAGDDTTRITHHGTPLSPAYASPEQLRGEQDLTPASDVFSLGVIGYEILAGERPFKGDRLHPPSGGFPPPTPLHQLNPAVPEAVSRVIHRALAEDRAERFPDAGALAAALATAEAELGAPPADAPRAIEPESQPIVIAATPAAAPSEPVAGEIPISTADAASPTPAPALAPAVVAGSGPDGVAVRGGAAGAHRRGAGARRKAGRGTALAIAVVAALVLAAGWLAMRDGEDDERSVADAGRTGAGQEQRVDAGAPVGPVVDGATPPGGGAPAVDPAAGTAAPGGAQRTADEARRIDPGVASPTTTPDRPARVATAPPAAPAPSPSPPTASTPPPERAPAASGEAAGSAAAARRQGQQRFERGDVDGAVALFRQAVRAAPGNAAYRNDLGWALLQAGDVDGAERELEETIRLDPRRAIAHANLGEVHAARGDTAAAIAAYERFLELNTDPRREQIARGKLRRLRGG